MCEQLLNKLDVLDWACNPNCLMFPIAADMGAAEKYDTKLKCKAMKPRLPRTYLAFAAFEHFSRCATIQLPNSVSKF